MLWKLGGILLAVDTDARLNNATVRFDEELGMNLMMMASPLNQLPSSELEFSLLKLVK